VCQAHIKYGYPKITTPRGVNNEVEKNFGESYGRESALASLAPPGIAKKNQRFFGLGGGKT